MALCTPSLSISAALLSAGFGPLATLLAMGLAVGIPSAIALGRFVAAQLYGIKVNDPGIAIAGVIVLIVVGQPLLAAAGLLAGALVAAPQPCGGTLAT